MDDVLDCLDKGLGTVQKQVAERVARHSRSYQCRCGNRIFFRNTLCLACRSQLGYLPDEGRIVVQDHRACFVDESKLIDRVQALGERLLERTGIRFAPRWPVV